MADNEMDEIRKRIEKLEAAVFGKSLKPGKVSLRKPLTLPELARKKSLQNGQQKVTLIVGYREKIMDDNAVTLTMIKSSWKDGKFTGSYNPVFLNRAIREGLIRDLKAGNFDLSQSGEDFFESVIKEG